MSYIAALEAAGAIVHASEHFGSYQGDILADVTYNDKRGILRIGYGSCSYCDHFESTFDYIEDHCGSYYSAEHDHNGKCEDCKKAQANYNDKLAAFGRDYLNAGLDNIDKVIADITPDMEWDGDAKYMVAWLNERKEVENV